MISTIAKAHSSMLISPLWIELSLSVHFAEVLHKEYTMATHMSHSGMDCIHKRAGRQTILVWQHTRCRGCCNPWSAMLRLQSSFFIHEVKGIPINSHGHLSHSPATNHRNVFHPQYPHLSLLARSLVHFQCLCSI